MKIWLWTYYVMAALQIVVSLWLWSLSRAMEEMVQKGEDRARSQLLGKNYAAYLVDLKKFWGPVWVIIPRNCSAVGRLQRNEDDDEEEDSCENTENRTAPGAGAAISTPPAESTTSPFSEFQYPYPMPYPYAAYLPYPTQPPSPLGAAGQSSDFAVARGLLPKASLRGLTENNETVKQEDHRNPSINATIYGNTSTAGWFGEVKFFFRHFIPTNKPDRRITVCNRTYKLGTVKYLPKYLSFVKFSRALHHGEAKGQSGKLFEEVRSSSTWWLMVLLPISLILIYGAHLGEFLVVTYQKWRPVPMEQRPSRFDTILWGILFNVLSSIYLLSLQACICTSSLAFWRESSQYLIQTWTPSFAMWVCFLKIALMTGVYFYDTLTRHISQCIGWRGLTAAWCFWIAVTVILTLPLIGLTVYNCQFMVKILMCGWLNADMKNMLQRGDVISTAFLAVWLCIFFVFITVVGTACRVWYHIEELRHQKLPLIPPPSVKSREQSVFLPYQYTPVQATRKADGKRPS